ITTLMVDFITTMVMARLLPPEAFGVVACALIFTGLATRLVNLGFPTALVRMKEVRDEHIRSTFTITFGWHLAIGALLAAFSPLLGMIFKSSQVGWIGMAFATTFATTPFSSISRALLQRRMNFKYT